MAAFPPARRSAMIPEPTTVASRSAVPIPSAAARFEREKVMRALNRSSERSCHVAATSPNRG